MANINLKKIVLQDNWPGTPNNNLGVPTGGFDAATHSDTTTPSYPIGTKIQQYQDFSSSTGMYTMIYLRYYCMSDDQAVEDISDGFGLFQAHCNSTCVSADGTSSVFACTNEGAIDIGTKEATTNGMVAFACSSLTDYDVTTDGNNGGGYGWFWCGGVCPYKDITAYDGQGAHAGTEVATDGNVAAAEVVHPVVASTAVVLGYAEISAHVCGYSLGTDA